MARYVTTITEEHRRNPYIKLGERGYYLGSVLGRVLPQDVGKRVYENVSPSGYRYLTVESTEQRDMRLGTHKPCVHARTRQYVAYGNIHCLTCGKQWDCNAIEYRDNNALYNERKRSV